VGHLRIGTLPKSARWREVVSLIESSPEDASRIARATLIASEGYLFEIRNDAALTRAYWTLVRLVNAARGRDFVGELGRLGLPSDPGTSTLSFLAAVAESVRRESAGQSDGSLAGELAGLALRRALMDTVGAQGASMFGSTLDDLQTAFRAQSTDRQFANVARLFFGDFVARVLTSAIDREAPLALGATDSGELIRQVDLHARQSARIMETFAADWLSKTRYEREGDISREDVQAFVAVALRKLRSELKREIERA